MFDLSGLAADEDYPIFHEIVIKGSCFLIFTTLALPTFDLTFNIDNAQNLAHKVLALPCTRKSQSISTKEANTTL